MDPQKYFKALLAWLGLLVTLVDVAEAPRLNRLKSTFCEGQWIGFQIIRATRILILSSGFLFDTRLLKSQDIGVLNTYTERQGGGASYEPGTKGI